MPDNVNDKVSKEPHWVEKINYRVGGINTKKGYKQVVELYTFYDPHIRDTPPPADLYPNKEQAIQACKEYNPEYTYVLIEVLTFTQGE